MTRPRGPLPKDPDKRERSGVPTYPTVVLGRTPAATAAPKLHNRAVWRKLHRETRAWWRMLLRAPQASEYLESDWTRLAEVILPLHEQYNRAKDERDVATMVKLAGEIRQQEADFGLTPTSRMRNRWAIRPVSKTDSDEENETTKRPRRPKRAALDDPRLSVVK